MIIAQLISFIVILSLIIIGLLVLVTVGTNASPMHCVMYNDYGEYTVPINNALVVSPFDYRTYNKNTLVICIDLIRRIEDLDTTTPLSYGIVKVAEFNSHISNKIFACIWDSPTTIWLSIRGTDNLKEWKNNFKIQQLNYDDAINEFSRVPAFMKQNKNIMVHKGFLSLFSNLIEDIENVVSKLCQNETKTLCINGHSLGGVMALLFGMEFQKSSKLNTCVYTLGCPRIGNIEFAHSCNEMDLPIFRIANTEDHFTDMPSSVSPNFKNAKKPYIYMHPGNAYTFTENLKSVSNNHSLFIYLKNLPP